MVGISGISGSEVCGTVDIASVRFLVEVTDNKSLNMTRIINRNRIHEHIAFGEFFWQIKILSDIKNVKTENRIYKNCILYVVCMDKNLMM
jgi:hypothetical protein